MEGYLKKLIAEGEHQTLDFKYEISDAKKIARSIVAFANTRGGRLLIGIKDNGNIIGVRSDEEIYMIETATHLYCKPEVSFKTTNHWIEGKNVVEIQVDPSNKRPHYAPGKNDEWTPFIRINDQNQVANNIILKVWENKTRPEGVFVTYTDAEKQLLGYIEQYGEISFTQARRVTRTNPVKLEQMLANFITLQLIEPVFTNQKTLYQLPSTGNFTF